MSLKNEDPVVHLVDDNEVDRIAFRRILSKAGIDVKEYDDPDSFLKEVDQISVACLVVDVCLPGLNGPELQLKLLERSLKIPIILVSGVATVPIATEGMRLGALDLLEKPVDPDRFVELVQKGFAISSDRDAQKRMVARLQEEWDTLTPEEQAMLPHVCEGLSLKAIAAKCDLQFTHAAHCQNSILEKFNSCNPMQLVKRFQMADFPVIVKSERKSDFLHA